VEEYALERIHSLITSWHTEEEVVEIAVAVVAVGGYRAQELWELPVKVMMAVPTMGEVVVQAVRALTVAELLIQVLVQVVLAVYQTYLAQLLITQVVVAVDDIIIQATEPLAHLAEQVVGAVVQAVMYQVLRELTIPAEVVVLAITVDRAL
jgi:hypothetical protein